MRFFLLIFLSLIVFRLTAQVGIDEAMDFKTVDIHGDSIHLFQIFEEGKHIVLDFFYADCEPCQRTAPYVNEAFEYFGCGEHELVFIGISDRDNDSICELFEQEYGVHYTTISGIEGNGASIAELYRVGAYPSIALIAPDHYILENDIYPIPSAEYIINPIAYHGFSEMPCSDYTVTTDFSLSSDSICKGSQIEFINTSTGIVQGIEWKFEGGDPAFSNKDTVLVNYDSTGSFKVSLHIWNNFETDSLILPNAVQVKDCSNTIEYESLTLGLFPNPGNGVFRFNKTPEKDYFFEIYDILGKRVTTGMIQRNKAIFNLSELKKGVYFIHFQSNNAYFTEKVIIE